MSQLKARCIDQVLTFENTPVITSGNVNYDSIMFDFCSAWDGFTKTAIFYRSEDEVFYQLLDEANTCIIPNEVLKEKGDVYIGVFGVSGETTITSQVLKYKVTRGAITEDLKPSDPTPDIYLQLISGYNHYDERLAYFEERFNGSVGDAEKLGGQLPSYYAPLSELAKYLPLDGSLTTNYNKVSDLDNFFSGICLFTGSIANSPTNSHWLVIAGSAGTGTVIQVAFDLLQNSGAKQRYRGGTTWNGWVDLKVNCLSLTGGQVKGTFSVRSDTASAIWTDINNTLRRVYQTIYSDGGYALVDGTNGKNIILSMLDGENNTFYGHSSKDLPLDGGGTISTDGTTPISLKNNIADVLYLQCLGASGILGYFGFRGKDRPIFIKSDASTVCDLLHTGNMTSHVLSLTGGTVTNEITPLEIKTTNTGNQVRLKFSGASGTLGWLGYVGADNPVVFDTVGVAKSLHHDGNSSKVHVGTSAPDTSSVWIDTSE